MMKGSSLMKIGMITCNYCLGIYGFQQPDPFDWSKMEEKYRQEFRRDEFIKLVSEIREMGYEHLEIWEPHFSYLSYSPDEAAALSGTLREMGVRGFAYCIGGWQAAHEPRVEQVYRFAHALGAETITGCIPLSGSEALLEEIDRCGKKYALRFAIENHPVPNLENPSDIRRVVEKYDTIGANMDVGIFHETGYDVLQAAALLKDKIYHVHLKDTVKGGGWPIGGSRPIGEGDTPVEDFLNLLQKWEYAHMVSVELESSGNPAAWLKKSFEYVHGKCLLMKD